MASAWLLRIMRRHYNKCFKERKENGSTHEDKCPGVVGGTV